MMKIERCAQWNECNVNCNSEKAILMCSNCKNVVHIRTKYCPHCGSRMFVTDRINAEELIEQIQKLTSGGGVTSPDDMVSIDDVVYIINEMRMGT